jgi:putative salt-induced outer membrane protein
VNPSRILASLSAAAALLAAAPAFAEELPTGLMKAKTATGGQENVASTGFEAPVAKPEASKDSTELKLSAGGLFSGGNSKSIAATGSSKLHLRRENNALDGALAANYGRSAPKGQGDMETSVENFQGKLRYDRFVAEHVAVFVALSGLKDRFLGLDLRLNLDPGLAYYFIDGPKHRLWAELGYDLQYDFRREETIVAALADGKTLDRSEVRHSGRLFLGYNNSISETLTFDTGVEYLQALKDTENFRLNWDLGITSSIGGNFSIATTLNLRYDHNPLPGVKNTDVTSAVSLVYQLL